jgi:hypothetical protein
MSTIEEGLVIELSAIAGLTTKVLPVQGGQNLKGPYVIYEPVGDERTRDLTSYDGAVIGDYQLNVFHECYSSLKVLMAAIVAEIKTWELAYLGTTGPYIQEIELKEGSGKIIYEARSLIYRGIIEFEMSYYE